MARLSNIRISLVQALRWLPAMDAFCERLKELNPKLETDRDASDRYMNYLNYHSSASDAFNSGNHLWQNDFRAFEEENIHPKRLMSTLFSDSLYVQTKIDQYKLMFGLFRIAGNMQDLDIDISFYDLFEKEELFTLFQCENLSFYTCYANSPLNKGLATANEQPLLENIIDCADKAIAENRTGADLRFGHDIVVAPLAAMLHLGSCDTSVNKPSDIWKAWSTFYVTPMAANIQLIFFRRKGFADILVKFLLNEKEMAIPVKTNIWPFYHWNEVKAYYQSLTSIVPDQNRLVN